jgi:multidrug resistance protein
MFTRSEKLLLMLLAFIQFTHIVDFMILMPLGPQLMRVFAITPTQFGYLVSSYTLSAGVSSFCSSLFIDRFDRKSALLFFFCGFSIGTIACALSPNYLFLLVARFITGFFGGVITSIVLSIVSDVIVSDKRGRAMGIVMGGFSLASVFGVPFGLFLANNYNWHAPFMFLGVTACFFILVIALALPKMRDHLKGPKTLQHFYDSLLHILKMPTQLWALLFMFCLVMGHFSIIPFLSASFVANGGLAEERLFYTYLIGGIISMIASPGFGWLSDKYGKVKIFYLGALSSIIPIYLITHLQPHPEWLILVLSSSFFLVMSGRMVPAMTLVSSSASPRYRASFMGISSSVQQLATATASGLASQIVVRSESGHLMQFSYVGYIAITFTLIAVYLINKIKVENN